MNRFSRFERKLLFALVAVAVVPMAGALVLGRGALLESYQVGVNSRVRGQLDSCLALQRERFGEMREHAESRVHAIAEDHRIRIALSARDVQAVQARLSEMVATYPDLAEVALNSEQVGGHFRARVAASSPARGQRELRLKEQIEEDGVVYALQATVHAPDKMFHDYLRAGELVEVFTRLERGQGMVSTYYLLVFMGLLVSVIVVAVALGIVLSRRVTRRIAVLAEATARVGAGDLSVQVPISAEDEIGELTRAFNAMVRDIHESRARIEYLQRLGAWQQFARRLAHEIKNPLTPIQLAVQEVHRSYRGEDEAFRQRLDDAATIVTEEVAALRRLVSEFSDFARLPRADLAPADLNDFLADASRGLVNLGPCYVLEESGEAAGEVICKTGVEPLSVRIDAMMLQRCLDNVVRNALQALRDAGRQGSVVLSASRQDDEAVLSVADDGPGVPEDQRERIFDPYVTSKTDGTGLGLAIVKKIIFEHGGEVYCSPRPGGGAIFSIRLPILD